MTAAPDAADAPAPHSTPAPTTSAHTPPSNPRPPSAATPVSTTDHAEADAPTPATAASVGAATSLSTTDHSPATTPADTTNHAEAGTPAPPDHRPASAPTSDDTFAPTPVDVEVSPASPIDILNQPSELDEPHSSTHTAKRTRPLTIVTVVLLAAAIAAGIAIGPTILRVAQQRNATLAMPESVAEFKRDDSDGAKEAATDLVTALRAEIALDDSAGAVYSDPTNDPGKSILLFGGTTLLLSPERELDAVLRLTEDAGDKIRDLQSVDPGPLGGIMKCGATGIETSPMAVCGWADHGSIALALFPERSPADAAFLMRTLRSATLSR